MLHGSSMSLQLILVVTLEEWLKQPLLQRRLFAGTLCPAVELKDPAWRFLSRNWMDWKQLNRQLEDA